LKREKLLAIDAFVNFTLGLTFIFYPQLIVTLIGVEISALSTVINILKATIAIFGGVLTGIGIALLLESLHRPKGLVGLGLGGAVVINLCGGIILSGWLIFGNLVIPKLMLVLLWILLAILVVLSVIEIYIHVQKQKIHVK